MICCSQLGSSPGTEEKNCKKKNEKHLVILTESPLATLVIDLEDRNYPGSLSCSLYGLQVIL